MEAVKYKAALGRNLQGFNNLGMSSVKRAICLPQGRY